jgi:G3E family GTPase
VYGTVRTVVWEEGCCKVLLLPDLIDTLQGLFRRQATGEITEFDRVVIETTGLADPTPILHALLTDRMLISHYRLNGVIATVDAATGRSTLDRRIESVKQAAVADRLLLTKADLADPAEIDDLTKRLHSLNPAAPILPARHGVVEPGRIFDAGLYDPKTKNIDVQRWLNAAAYVASLPRRDDQIGSHYQAKRRAERHNHEPNRHDERVKAIYLTVDEPIAGEAFDEWLDALVTIKGPDLLRVKGILNIANCRDPVVVHGVQHVFHPPVRLTKWPSDDRRSRIVVIARDMDENAVRESFTLFTKHAPIYAVPA